MFVHLLFSMHSYAIHVQYICLENRLMIRDKIKHAVPLIKVGGQIPPTRRTLCLVKHGALENLEGNTGLNDHPQIISSFRRFYCIDDAGGYSPVVPRYPALFHLKVVKGHQSLRGALRRQNAAELGVIAMSVVYGVVCLSISLQRIARTLGERQSTEAVQSDSNSSVLLWS